MTVETATYISQLNTSYPANSDDVSEGGGTSPKGHINLIKEVLQAQFPNLTAAAVNSTVDELNYNNLTTLGTAENSKVVTVDGSGVSNFADKVVQRPEIKDYAETYNASSGSGTVDLDLQTGNVFQHTASGGNVTFTFSNPPASGKAGSLTLKWIQDSSDRTITWPASVDWAGGSAPSVTSGSAKVDMYVFTTFDAGTTWYGFQAAADLS
ncbi:MAG: hypothetical protein ACPHCV_00655 [Pseudohongiellaceae bacterium]